MKLEIIQISIDENTLSTRTIEIPAEAGILIASLSELLELANLDPPNADNTYAIFFDNCLWDPKTILIPISQSKSPSDDPVKIMLIKQKQSKQKIYRAIPSDDPRSTKLVEQLVLSSELERECGFKWANKCIFSPGLLRTLQQQRVALQTVFMSKLYEADILRIMQNPGNERFSLLKSKFGYGVLARKPLLPGELIGIYAGIGASYIEYCRAYEATGVSSEYSFKVGISDFLIDTKQAGNITRFLQSAPIRRHELQAWQQQYGKLNSYKPCDIGGKDDKKSCIQIIPEIAKEVGCANVYWVPHQLNTGEIVFVFIAGKKIDAGHMLFIDYGRSYVQPMIRNGKEFTLFTKTGTPLCPVFKAKVGVEEPAIFLDYPAKAIQDQEPLFQVERAVDAKIEERITKILEITDGPAAEFAQELRDIIESIVQAVKKHSTVMVPSIRAICLMKIKELLSCLKYNEATSAGPRSSPAARPC